MVMSPFTKIEMTPLRIVFALIGGNKGERGAMDDSQGSETTLFTDASK